MRRLWVIPMSLAVMAVFSSAITITSLGESGAIRGDYVEVRTASVFAGACHYNGEVTTTGRDALMAWSVTSGKWNGVDLTGMRAIAVVSSDDNLSNAQAGRRAELIIDKSASHEQTVVMLEAIKSRYAE